MASYAENRKARFNYDFLEEFEAGIELLGFEVKAARAGQVSFDGAHVLPRGGEAYLIGATITPLQPKNVGESYDPARPRRLLLSKEEINRLIGLESKQGLTIVPISMYNKGRRVKVSIAVARGKKQFDKRASIQKRETDIDIQRALKRE